MSDPTQPQSSAERPVPSFISGLATIAANRNWLSSLGGALGLWMLLGTLDQHQVNDIISGSQQVMNGLGDIAAGFKTIWLALPTGLVATLAAYAGKAQIVNTSIWGSLLNLGKKESKDKGIVVVAPAPIANSVPGANIIPDNRATVVVPTVIADAQADAAPVVRASEVVAQPHIVQK